jgi:predicted metal-dependent peptidase
MTKARLGLMFDGHVFFAALSFHLIPVLVEDEALAKRIWRGQPPTMATDGKHMFYHRGFLAKLDPVHGFKQLMGVIAHEALHYGLCHMFRMGERDPILHNIACDIPINHHIKAAGLALPPDHIHIDDPKVRAMFRPLPAGVTWDQVAGEWDSERIFNHFDKDKTGGSKQRMPQWGIILKPQSEDGTGEGEGQDMSESDMRELEARARDAMTQAAASASMAGKMPGTLQGVMDEMLKPQVDWRSVMQRFIAQSVPFDYTWRKPGRRHMHRGMYMPSAKKRNFGTLVVINDTSGSVSDNEQKHFVGEVNAISTMFDFDEIITIPCDYAVHEAGIRRHKRGEQITSLRVDGRGGTSFRPPFEWLAKHQDIKPIRIIYLTDLEGDFPPEYEVPTLWVATTKHKAPWGETVHIDVGRGG